MEDQFDYDEGEGIKLSTIVGFASFILTAIGVGMAYLVQNPLSNWETVAFVSVIAGVIATLVLTIGVKKAFPDLSRTEFFKSGHRVPARHQDLIIDQVTKHFAALSRNIATSLRINDYGAVISDERRAAVLEFLHSVGIDPEDRSEDYVCFVITVVREMEMELADRGFNPDSAPVNGHDFERWVATELIRFGWEARVTTGAGDQGIDVIASKLGVSVGIQCKRYNSAVGNKSVQEALSGKQYYGLDVAAVLTNATYTKSAYRLAETADVVLMTHYDIPNAQEILLTRQLSSNSYKTAG